MITSIPSLAAKVGFNHETYTELARNIKRMQNIPKSARQRILDRANNELSAELRTKAHPLIEKMAYDRQVYREAELNYGQGPPKDEGLFTTALADYLLRHQEDLKSIP